MSTTELLDAVLTANGVDVESLPDRLETTYLRAIYEANGGNPDELPDNLTTTLLGAIASVASGGGNTGGGGGDIDAFIDGSVTEITSNAEQIGFYALAWREKLVSINFPECKSIGQNGVTYCPVLKTANFPKLTYLNVSGLRQCHSLVSVNMPLLAQMESHAFYDCYELPKLDFPKITYISYQTFQNCRKLTALILRAESVVTLVSTNSFTSTPIASGTGYIYVPRSLVDSYKSATNWSTYANQFRALEDYTVDGTITGELDESKI